VADLKIYDTTLRDGAQAEGICFSVEDKLKIVRALDEFGIHYIEGGWPSSNPKDAEFFERTKHLRLRNSRLAAFASTCKPTMAAETDPNLQALVQAGTPVVTIVGKSSDFHVTRVLGTSLEENLDMIARSVSFLKSQGLEVVFDAEHFFDGYRSNKHYAMRTLQAASEAGADWLVLCDTNGGSMPDLIGEAVSFATSELGTAVGIHTHNDADLAVANSIIAVRQGATMVQGTINGYGERCGNANLCSIIPSLELKMGMPCIGQDQLKFLTRTSHYVAEVANLASSSKLPYVGASAFAHKGGLHVDAVAKDAAAYEHIPPEAVGNTQRVLVSELGGRSNILLRAQHLGIDLSSQSDEVRRMVTTIKEMESKGFQFEDAEASFELLVRRTQAGYKPPFSVVDFVVLVDKRKGADLLSEATVKIEVGGRIIHTAAEGNGPVNALDAALRKALQEFYPQLASVRLVDYKVRVLEDSEGTGSTVRVSITSTDGDRTWGTIGGSTNIIEASWRALSDSVEYPLIKWMLTEVDEGACSAESS
jgi:2-isopropylmalate synthase